MIKYTYDPEVDAAYIYLREGDAKVGTLKVEGNIRFRKPSKTVKLEGDIILDFTEDGELAGVEILGSAIPSMLKKA
jgi:uncharacterized protein YuzE